MISIESVEVTSFKQICRILYDKESGDAVVIDPGGDAAKIISKLQDLKVSPKQIWLTHCHLDHCGAVAALKREYDCELLAGEADSFLREKVNDHAMMFGVPEGELEDCPEPDSFFQDGDKLKVSGTEFSVLHAPGHTPGHFCFYSKQLETVIAGDVIFAGSVGRTDLPGGDHDQLIKSIREKILTLPGNTRILCGHGFDTQVQQEADTNPYLIF